METKASIRTKYKTLRNAMPENIVREESQRFVRISVPGKSFRKHKIVSFIIPLGKKLLYCLF